MTSSGTFLQRKWLQALIAALSAYAMLIVIAINMNASSVIAPLSGLFFGISGVAAVLLLALKRLPLLASAAIGAGVGLLGAIAILATIQV